MNLFPPLNNFVYFQFIFIYFQFDEFYLIIFFFSFAYFLLFFSCFVKVYQNLTLVMIRVIIHLLLQCVLMMVHSLEVLNLTFFQFFSFQFFKFLINLKFFFCLNIGIPDNLKLYEYITQHFIATLMKPCRYFSTTIKLVNGQRSIILFPLIVVTALLTALLITKNL